MTEDQRSVKRSMEETLGRAQPLGNRFDRMEWAGAFGDLGTLIPFVLAYVSVMGLDPLPVFGIARHSRFNR
jgi:hypothetical protein